MPVDLFQCSPLLEPLVHMLMPATGILLGSQISMRNSHTRSANQMRVASVSFVRFHLLSRQQHVDELPLEDSDIRPPATWKGTANPNNISSLNADTYLISDSRSLEFVRKPALVEWMLLLNAKVGAIDCDLALATNIIPESILPANLQQEQRKRVVRVIDCLEKKEKATATIERTYNIRRKICDGTEHQLHPLSKGLSSCSSARSIAELSSIGLEEEQSPHKVLWHGSPREKLVLLELVPKHKTRGRACTKG